MSQANQIETRETASANESGEQRSQFVTFNIGCECMAFDMERVMEIVRVPDTVDVPMTPSSLMGLANLRGSILPVLSLRRVFGLEDVEKNDATRVMVLNVGGQPLGFVVDKVTRVIDVLPESIEGLEAVRSSIDAKLLMGVLKEVDEQGLVQLVNIDALTQQEYAHFGNDVVQQNSGNTLQSNSLADTSTSGDNEEQNILQLVSFSVADQEYSFSIDATQEIIRLPETINSVPKAPPHVIGMINLRNRVLPLVKLRTMFHLPEQELSEMNRIVVLTLKQGKEVSMVGVVVDEVKEVLRIHKKLIEDVPSLLLDSRDVQELEGICQLDDGQRIVTLLSAEKLFNRNELLEAVEAVEEFNQELRHDNDQLEENVENVLSHTTEEEESQLVVFNLKDQEYGVKIESVREILRLPDNLTSVPKTSSFVEGIVNLRGAVLPIIDMRSRFDVERQQANDRQRILVLNDNEVLTGYIVDSVSEVLRLQQGQIEDAPHLSEEQNKIMGKIVNLREQHRIITVLEPDYLLTGEEHTQLVEEVYETVNS